VVGKEGTAVRRGGVVAEVHTIPMKNKQQQKQNQRSF